METMRQRFVSTVNSLLSTEPRLALVLADISMDAEYFLPTVFEHPGRVINVGIREQLMVGVAAGMALEGMRPIVHSYAPFIVERPYESLKVDMSYQGVGAVFVSIGASYDWAPGGRTHHTPGDVAVIDALPDWTVHVPGHPDEAEVLLRDAVAGTGPVYVRLSIQANGTSQPVVPGRFSVIRQGTRGTVIAVGPMLDRVLEATRELDLTVLYAATVRPFDAETLTQTLGKPELIVVEPYVEGTSAHVASSALSHVPHRLLSIGVARRELRCYGTPEQHDAAYGLDVPGLRERITAFLR